MIPVLVCQFVYRIPLQTNKKCRTQRAKTAATKPTLKIQTAVDQIEGSQWKVDGFDKRPSSESAIVPSAPWMHLPVITIHWDRCKLLLSSLYPRKSLSRSHPKKQTVGKIPNAIVNTEKQSLWTFDGDNDCDKRCQRFVGHTLKVIFRSSGSTLAQTDFRNLPKSCTSTPVHSSNNFSRFALISQPTIFNPTLSYSVRAVTS